MRKKYQKQMPLMITGIDHARAMEFKAISRILDDNPIINEMVLQDLTPDVEHPDTGAQGMTAEQVVRAAIIKQTEGYSYEDLAFHIVDSRCYRSFCRIGITDKGFQKSALCHNIKAISPETWEAINRILVAYAEEHKIEKGREVRMDSTVVSSNIHEPSDSSLLWDSVRVLSRMLGQINEQLDSFNIPFTDHSKRAKRRMLGIMNAKSKKTRKRQYVDLLKVTRKTLSYAETALCLLKGPHLAMAQSMPEELRHYIELTRRVIEQTERRVIYGESVPASEKIVSLFEPHTDIIVKDRRETFYGHKVCLNGGSSSLITDCVIVDGNPADSTLTEQMLDRHEEIYGRYPLKAAFDGGFASKENLRSAKAKGIKDVCFAKKRGIEAEDMCRSQWVYKRLRRFRAGIESAISWIKRCFGFASCTWKSLRSFKSYVWASIVSANLLTLARKEMC
ncbi:MAG: ISNCY family transposase [Desulfobacteraceae bacterium]|nr:MAG: ISNCY family transposase [Desulfobacteraceae bacterium]